MQVPMTLAMVGKEETSRKRETACSSNWRTDLSVRARCWPPWLPFLLDRWQRNVGMLSTSPSRGMLPQSARGLCSWRSLDIETIKEQQDADQKLQQTATKYADQYPRKSIRGVNDVLCYVKPGDPPANWRIALPESMLQPTIWWVCQITGQPGSKRLHMQISTCYSHSNLRILIDNYHCDHCQRNSLMAKGMDTCRNARFILCHSRNAP